MKNLVHSLTACVVLAAAFSPYPACADQPATILDQSGYWRQYCRFGSDRVAADILTSEGEKLLGAAKLQQARKAAEDGMRKSGLDPATTDWKQHVYVWLFFEQYPPYFSPAPAADWAKPQFDDSAWVFQRGPVLAPEKERIVPCGAGWTTQELDQAAFSGLGIQTCYYRARFVVDAPAKATDLKLSCQYRGGVRILVNGQEAARQHLPSLSAGSGQADAADAPAETYPLAAYTDQPALRDRSAGAVAIQSSLLQKGVNILAVEVRAARLHPAVLKMNLPLVNHKVRQGMEGLWTHCELMKVELTTASPAGQSALKRPPGVQVWAQDMHHRTESTEFLPPGEPAGQVRFVGPRNGSFSVQVLAGTDKPLTDLRVQCSDLTAAGGSKIPTSAIAVFFSAPFPAEEFTSAKLGDDRGLGATFPDAQTLACWEAAGDAGKTCLFDHLAPAPRPAIPAGSCQPVWLTLRIPADAKPGVYQGQVAVQANGVEAIGLPVRAEIFDWTLPAPKEFRTVVACEENPYGVAKQYGLTLWSDQHRKALAASFRQLARVGNDWLNVPVLARTEFGNRDDSLIRWTRKKDGALAFDYSLLDAYLDLAIENCGQPKVINFVIMQGAKSSSQPPAVPFVYVTDEATGQKQVQKLTGISKDEKEKVRGQFAKSLYEHMQARKLDKAMFWGFPLEQEDDPELKTLLAQLVPAVNWAANPHEMYWNATYAKDKHYGAIITVRHMFNLPGFRMDEGWRSRSTSPSSSWPIRPRRR